MKRSARSGFTLLSFILVAALAGCAAVPPREGIRTSSARDIATDFVRRVIANDVEGAFGLLDISSSLVNYGNPQTAFYSSLGPEDRARYRKDFVEGIYVFLFRGLAPEQSLFTIVSRNPLEPVVEVTGRPGKKLLLTLTDTEEGVRISRIDKGN